MQFIRYLGVVLFLVLMLPLAVNIYDAAQHLMSGSESPKPDEALRTIRDNVFLFLILLLAINHLRNRMKPN